MACLSVAEANPYVYNLGPDNSSAAPAFVAAGVEVAGTDEPRVAFAYSDTLTNTALSEEIPGAVDEAGGRSSRRRRSPRRRPTTRARPRSSWRPSPT